MMPGAPSGGRVPSLEGWLFLAAREGGWLLFERR
jgi:hypothetical protein